MCYIVVQLLFLTRAIVCMHVHPYSLSVLSVCYTNDLCQNNMSSDYFTVFCRAYD